MLNAIVQNEMKPCPIVIRRRLSVYLAAPSQIANTPAIMIMVEINRFSGDSLETTVNCE